MKIARIHNCAMAEFIDSITSVVFVCGCDLNCDFCHNDELINCFKFQQDMTSQEVMSEIKWKAIDWVSFTGGEPLVHVDFAGMMEVIKHAKNIGKKVNIDSNGFFTYGSPKGNNLKRLRGLLDCISIDIKVDLVGNMHYGNMAKWLESAKVACGVRYRMVILNEKAWKYTSKETMRFLDMNGIDEIVLMKNSRLGRGQMFGVTDAALIEKITRLYSASGIKTIP